MAEIILCRHGFTPANNVGWNKQHGIAEAIYYDELCPLDQKYGVAQTEELGAFLAEKYQGKNILVCYSPYYRTRQTALNVVQPLAENNSITTRCVPSLREINQGLNYARTKDMFDTDDYEAQSFYDEIKSPHKVAVSYLQGESEVEVRRRVRRFANELKNYQKTSQMDGQEYDVVIVVSHETVIHNLYYDMFNKPDNLKILTASAMQCDENPEVLFAPQISVPKGHFVDFKDYEEYFRLRAFYDKIAELKQDSKFRTFFERDLTMPTASETTTFEKSGETLTILPNNTPEKGLFLIDSALGQDGYAYDKQSTSTYFILDGSGEFDINGKKLAVAQGDYVVIPPNTTFYYKGKMKLIEKMTPNFQPENVVPVKPVTYKQKPVYDFMPAQEPNPNAQQLS